MTLLSEIDLIDRIFEHIDGKTTDVGDAVWQEPTENYRSQERFDAEIALMRQLPVAFCPSAALPQPGSFIARTAAKTPILAVRGDDGIVRAFRNACRHRGMPVGQGEGCQRAFVCPYHAWTYGLDGKLKHIPGEQGFPDLDKAMHNLVPVTAEERGGLVFITQDEPLSNGALEDMPDLIAPDQAVFNTIEFTDKANWKLFAETFMEGYHIKALHTKSFYPYGYDNLNIVETFSRNSRVVFPFQRIEKLRDKPRAEWRAQGLVTDVYHLFPNTLVVELSNHAMLVVLEPISVSETRTVVYQFSLTSKDGEEIDMAAAKRDASFVQDDGLIEDRNAACAIQAGLEANANSHFTFGKLENVICHFHKNLTEHVGMLK
jgi:phenylpropionate dioxygenase-like ring-hydroxylating dioxygenase large terminal subunit